MTAASQQVVADGPMEHRPAMPRPVLLVDIDHLPISVELFPREVLHQNPSLGRLDHGPSLNKTQQHVISTQS